MIKVHKLETSNYTLWDDFVNNHFCQLYALKTSWKNFIEDAFSYKASYYYFTKEEKIIGVFPLYHIKSLICGSRFVSVPFSDCGGIYFDKTISAEEKKEAWNLIKDLNISRPFDFRGIDQNSCSFFEKDKEFTTYSPYVQMEIDLTKSLADIENNFSNNIKRNIKASQQIDVKKTETIDEKLYEFYLKEMKKFGSPPLKFSFFTKQKHYLKEALIIFTAFHNTQTVGGLTCIAAGNTLYADIIISDDKHNDLHPKHRLYEHALKYAKDNNFKTLNLSRTRKNTGVYEHKRRWGAEEKSIYCACSRNAIHLAVDEKSKKVKFVSLIFKFTPKLILQTAGPLLRKHLGQ